MAFDAYLAHEFARRQSRNKRYSLRSFARDLDCDHATLSQWIRGKRPITRDDLDKLCKALRLGRTARARAEVFEPFDMDVVAAVRTLAQPTTPAIAECLSASIDRVNIALHQLLRLGMLRMEGTHWRET